MPWRQTLAPPPPPSAQANTIIEKTHQVIGNLERTYNLQETYVDVADPWMGILAAAACAAQSTYHKTKQKRLVHLVFSKYMIPPINHVADWRCISQRKQNQLDKYVICENITIIDHDYRVADQVMMGSKYAFKYETLFK